MRDKTPTLRSRFKAERGNLAISTIVLYELLYGAENSQDPTVARAKVNEFAAAVEVAEFDRAAAAHSGEIRAELRKKGQLIGAYDLLIAGHARSLGLKLISGNLREFSRVDGLRCEDWF